MLLGNASPVVTLWLEGTTDFGFSRLYVDQNASNFGILKLECTSNDGNNQNSYVETRNNARLTNETTGIIESNAGAGDSRFLTGTLVQQGAHQCHDRDHVPGTAGGRRRLLLRIHFS